MKTQTKHLLVMTLLLLNAATASAIFVPVPIPEETPLSIDFGVDPKMYFSPNYRLTHIGASAAASYRIWEGLELGLQARGGVNDSTNGLFSSASTYRGDLGGDLMARYMISMCRFYVGLQTVFGYDYFFNNAGTFNTNSLMNLAIGIPFGINFEGTISAYVMPTVEFGNKSATDTGAWGSLVSGSVALGTMINLGGPSLILEVAPRIDNFNNVAATTGLKTFIGLGWEI